MKYCVKCGMSISAESKSCPGCGADNNFKVPEKKQPEDKVKKISKNTSLILSIISFIIALAPIITLYYCIDTGPGTLKENLVFASALMFSFFGLIELPISGMGLGLAIAAYATNKNNILAILSIILTIFPYVLFFFVLYLC